MPPIAADRALDATLIIANHILMRSKRSLNLENNHSYAINLHCVALCIVFTAGHAPSHGQPAARWELILKSNLHQTGRGTHPRTMLLHVHAQEPDKAAAATTPGLQQQHLSVAELFLCKMPLQYLAGFPFYLSRQHMTTLH